MMDTFQYTDFADHEFSNTKASRSIIYIPYLLGCFPRSKISNSRSNNRSTASSRAHIHSRPAPNGEKKKRRMRKKKGSLPFCFSDGRSLAEKPRSFPTVPPRPSCESMLMHACSMHPKVDHLPGRNTRGRTQTRPQPQWPAGSSSPDALAAGSSLQSPRRVCAV